MQSCESKGVVGHFETKIKMMRHIIVIAIIVITISCQSKYNKNSNESISKKLDSVLFKNDSLLKELTNSYEFKYYADGIGQDLEKPIFNDSLIFLKNEITKKIDFKLINKGKSILLDSISICTLSRKFDSMKQVMRRFIVLERTSNSDEINLIRIKAKSWVPQFIDGETKCIEAFSESFLGELKFD